MKLHAPAKVSWKGPAVVARVTRDGGLPEAVRPKHVWLASDRAECAPAQERFAAVLVREGTSAAATANDDRVVVLPDDLAYLDEGDVVRIDPARGRVHVLFRKSSPHNFLLVTEQCNSRCLMCSQPPVSRDDGWIVGELLKAIPLMDRGTREVGITGGEPTLLHEGLVKLLVALRDHLPDTAAHVLTNGRLFSYLKYAEMVAGVKHPDLMFGIPIYADTPERHDFVVQARGAFDETVRGILNLTRFGVRVEVRVVLHAQTVSRLPQLARWLCRNMPFVDHVALMGLEMTGYTRLNLEALWIDPIDYARELESAVHLLAQSGLTVSIYNHPLCLLEPSLWPFARKSISDWKNVYVPECEGCAARSECGGFFASSELRRSAHIRAVRPEGMPQHR